MSYKPGSVVGDYVVIGVAGAGGMGAVYKVQHVITQRIEAMKLLASGNTDPDQEQRFVREMQVQARLHHPNIAAVYNAFRFYDEFFLVLEFIEGESLETVLGRGRLPLGIGLHFARQALFALGYAHAHGVVHRDIAPSNMLITPDGTVKLTDFGLAKTATDIRLTHSGAPMGSPWYMSPEQVRGNSTLDGRSDTYSLGAVLYEIATGAKPFDLPSTFDVMRAHVEMPPQDPSEKAPELPAELSRIILTALAKDPNARFQSAEQFYTALEALQIAAGPAVRPATQPATPHPAPAPVSASAPVRPGPAPAVLVRRKPHPGMTVRMVQAALGTAVCGIALFGGIATYSFLKGSTATAAPAIPPLAVVKPAIPTPPPEPPAALDPPPPADEAVSEPPETSLPPEPIRPARRIRKVAEHPAARLNFSTPPAASAAPSNFAPAVLPPAPARTEIEPPLAASAPPATARPAASESASARPNADIPDDPPVITGPSDSSSDSKGKKDGNRFLRALHKVVSFHRQSGSEPSAASDSAPGN